MPAAAALNMLQQILLSCVLPASLGAAVLVTASVTTRWRASGQDSVPFAQARRGSWGAALAVVLGASLMAQEGVPDGSSVARWHAILPAAAVMALAGAASSMATPSRIGAWAGPVMAALACGGLAWLLPDTGGVGTILSVLVITTLGAAAMARGSPAATRDAIRLAILAHAGSFAAVFASLAALSLHGRFAKLALICAALAGFCCLGGLLAVRLRAAPGPSAAVSSLGVVACCAIAGFAYTGDSVPAWCWIAAFVAAPAGSMLASLSRRRGFSRRRALAVQLIAAVLLAACGWAWLNVQQARQGSDGPASIDAAYG